MGWGLHFLRGFDKLSCADLNLNRDPRQVKRQVPLYRKLGRLEADHQIVHAWVRGVARLTRLPVTEKIEGSNPFAPAIKNPAFALDF